MTEPRQDEDFLERMSARAEEALGKVAEELISNPVVNGAITRAFEAREKAVQAQVTAMVTKILALQAKPTPADAADALAIAICHCWRAPMIARMAAAEAMAADQRRKYAAKLKAAR